MALLNGAPPLPEPSRVQLPRFGGRIFPAELVHPGTFSISHNFEEVADWGKDAIMTFQTQSVGDFGTVATLKCWRPDPTTPGVYQYAEKSIDASSLWKARGILDITNIGRIEIDGDSLVVSPKRTYTNHIILGGLTLFCTLAVAMGIGIFKGKIP